MLKVKFGKDVLEISDLTAESSIGELKGKLRLITQCDNIKLIQSGKVLKDDQATLESLPSGMSTKLTMTGSKELPPSSAVTALTQSHVERVRIIDDLTVPMTYKSQHKPSNSGTNFNRPYGFKSIQTLSGLPNEQKAREILQSLAEDAGVLAVMNKHNWSVGALCELYPEGYVGVSDVCVMGLNENNGQRILLRLRTDDMKGFRKILSIKKVLYHELAHNVHSEHNDQFYMLMRQIEREASELDWKNSNGNTLNGGHHHHTQQSSNNDGQYYYPHGMPQQNQQNGSSLITGGVHRLGSLTDSNSIDGNGLMRNLIPARYLAGTAAILRLSAEEQEVESGCGCSRRNVALTTTTTTTTTTATATTAVVTDAATATATVADAVAVEDIVCMECSTSSSPNPNESNALLDPNITAATNTTTMVMTGMEMDNSTINASNSTDPTAATESGSNNYYQLLNTMETEQTESMSHAGAADNIALNKNVGGIGIEPPAQEESGPAATPMVSEISLEWLSGLILGQVDDAIAVGLSLDSTASPVEKLLQLRDALEKMLQSFFAERNEATTVAAAAATASITTPTPQTVAEASTTKLVKCLQLLAKILTNAKDHPHEQKYRSVNITGKTFKSVAGSVPGAMEVLYAAGFSAATTATTATTTAAAVDVLPMNSISNSLVQQPQQHIELSRQDPGLLYVIQSIVDSAATTASTAAM